MGQGDVETYAVDGAWHNRLVGGRDLPGAHPSRQDAVREGSAAAVERHVHHVIRYVGPAVDTRRRRT